MHPTDGPLTAVSAQIDHSFSADGVAVIRTRLAAADTDWAREQLTVLDRMSPASLEVTHELISQGRDRSLDACLRAEFDAACEVTRSPDFIEGVRAVLVDKDQLPKWSPRRLADVDASGITAAVEGDAPGNRGA